MTTITPSQLETIIIAGVTMFATLALFVIIILVILKNKLDHAHYNPSHRTNAGNKNYDSLCTYDGESTGLEGWEGY